MDRQASLRLVLTLTKGLNRWVQRDHDLQAGVAATLLQQCQHHQLGLLMQHPVQVHQVPCMATRAFATQSVSRLEQHAKSQPVTLPSEWSVKPSSGAKQVTGNRPRGQGAGARGGRPLSAVDQFVAKFYQALNSDPESDPGAQGNRAGAARALVDLMAMSLGLTTQDTSAATLVASSEPPAADAFPRERRLPLGVFRDAMRAIVMIHQLPVEPWRNSQQASYMQLQVSSAEVAEVAAEVAVLLRAMEATPGMEPDATKYNVLLCALGLAGQPQLAVTLFNRMAAGHKGPAAHPDLQSATQMFAALKRAQDVSGMWRAVQEFASSRQLRDRFKHTLPRLLSYTANRTLPAALHHAQWQIVQELLQWVEQQQQQQQRRQLEQVQGQEAQEQQLEAAAGMVKLFDDNLQLTVGMAAQADQLDIAATAWRLSQGIQLREDVVCAVLQACARADPDTLTAHAPMAKQAFEQLRSTLAAISSAVPGTGTGRTDAEAPVGPQRDTLAAYIHLLSRLHDWEAAFDAAAQLESLHASQHPASVSALHGLAHMAEEVARTPGGIAAAYDVLLRRQAGGQAVSTCLMNVVLRAMALSGAVEQCGRLFEEYGTAGFTQDTGAYNAVIESCLVAKQPVKAVSVLSYMKSNGVQPDDDSWDLLLRVHLAAGDVGAARGVLLDLRKAGATARLPSMELALRLAKEQGHGFLESEFQAEVDHLHDKMRFEAEKRARREDWRQLRREQEEQQQQHVEEEDGTPRQQKRGRRRQRATALTDAPGTAPPADAMTTPPDG